VEVQAREVLRKQGPVLEGKLYKKSVIKFLWKWKCIKIAKDDDKKKELFDLYLWHPKSPMPKPWPDDEDLELQKLLKPEMSFQETHPGVAA